MNEFEMVIKELQGQMQQVRPRGNNPKVGTTGVTGQYDT
jgi:hypothetical protein